MRHRSFMEFFAEFAKVVQVRLFVRWFLQHTFQRQARGLVSKLHILSGGPDLVAASARFLSGLETKLVPLGAPLADALMAHGSNRERAVALEDFAPMGFIGQLHPCELRLDLRAGQSLKFLFRLRVSASRHRAEDRAHNRVHLHRVLHWSKSVWRSENISATPDTSSRVSTILRKPTSSTRP